ncbi:hypothetical protein [Alicyclobacillus vulcanalis]|uniref:hypothetical protein n=1 Tax=Alicyclobacillus vulcanalis TaxID=252246 RepID=UPI0013566368|nr:hypothetical protein [Alicyclobacillus vulcanalis]
MSKMVVFPFLEGEIDEDDGKQPTVQFVMTLSSLIELQLEQLLAMLEVSRWILE